MRGLIKTVFGDTRTVMIVAICIMLSIAVLHSPFASRTGLVLPLLLIAGAGNLVKY